MNLRDALINQSPSLTLQRAAGDEIARLDAELATARERIHELETQLSAQQTETVNSRSPIKGL